MELLSSAGVSDADRTKQNSGTDLVYNGETDGIGHRKQVKMADLPVVNVDEPQIGTALSDCQVEGQRFSGDCHDVEDDDLSTQNDCTEPPDNHQITVDSIESEPSNCRDSESSLSEPKWLQRDEAVALWVKWRGKWQAGIRCARADWPLSTLRAKPTHDRKKYFVIFFPHTKNYSWADMMLVRSIYEFPQPNACRTHKFGLKMVKDLNVARRFIMKKLAIGMLNIVDQLHLEALVDTAREVMFWKEFATGVVRCSGYSDLGQMLLKLESMIMLRYVNSEWLQQSFHSWAQRCQAAQSAESIELLKEELAESILWNEVNSLSDAPMQQTLGSEWRSYKHEALKWFSTSRSLSTTADIELKRCESPSSAGLSVSRKRPKLEIRRAELHSSQAETTDPLQPLATETDSRFFGIRDCTKATSVTSEISKADEVKERATPLESSPCSVADRWDGIVVEKTPVNDVANKKALDFGSKNRQCTAFIEAKGRQCVRWANDGDVYCCVHLTSRFIGSSTKTETTPPVNSPMCGGTTVLGNQCKHRSLPGSLFCKKHGPRVDPTSNLANNVLKRKLGEFIPGSETSYCKDVVLVGQVEGPNFENSFQDHSSTEVLHCIGSSIVGSDISCRETPKRYSLYCDNHVPSWLKRARNGKSRIIPKEVFIDLLKGCVSKSQKLCLHKACELFYKLFKSIMSMRNPVPMDVQLQWALSEAFKDSGVGELLFKLVCTEKARLAEMWGFTGGENTRISAINDEPPALELAIDSSSLGSDEKSVRCKFCLEEFLDDQELGSHCMDNHKKEAQWLFRGHACAICLDSFTNRKLLETHVQERHNMEFVEQFMLLQCIPCGSHFGNVEELWRHVLLVHPAEFRMSKDSEKEASLQQNLELGYPLTVDEGLGDRKFLCKLCGLKFDLLPDLGRHHQAAHMGANLSNSRPPKRGIHHYSYRLKSGRLSRPGFKKILGTAAYKIRNRSNAYLKKQIQAQKSVSINDLRTNPAISQPEALGRLAESQRSSVANMLFSEIQKTKPRPSNLEILAAARAACCKISLNAFLERKYGDLPERLYLKAAKLCSEHNIIVQWHQDGFVCPKGCKSFENQGLLLPLIPRQNYAAVKESANLTDNSNNEWEVDECHYVIDLPDFREIPIQKVSVLCKDISFGKESIPIACVVDEELVASVNVSPDVFDGQVSNFTYIARPLLDQSHKPDIENLQLGCACPNSLCLPERCDHVYLFDNDFEDAIDIYGKSMHGRFPYDKNGHLILEEGYLVYECNHKCSCPKTCPNRILQNGLRVKLEVFKTKNKGWGVRTCEPILRGTFVCEYIGEVLDQQQANERRGRYGKQGCSYVYGIDAHANDMSRLVEGQEDYVIDATKYGNVSRFINHSCMPNLVNHQVLVDSMEPLYSHIGLYASRDIMSGEELTHNYHYNLMPGDGIPCHCGTSKCRGRLY